MSKPVFEDLFRFSGRRNRKSFVLYQLALACVLGAVAGGLWAAVVNEALGAPALVLTLVVILPALVSAAAVGAQRCHDFGWTGWAQLVGLVPYAGVALPLALMVVPGTPGENRYGPDPLREVPTARFNRVTGAV